MRRVRRLLLVGAALLPLAAVSGPMFGVHPPAAYADKCKPQRDCTPDDQRPPDDNEGSPTTTQPPPTTTTTAGSAPSSGLSAPPPSGSPAPASAPSAAPAPAASSAPASSGSSGSSAPAASSPAASGRGPISPAAARAAARTQRTPDVLSGAVATTTPDPLAAVAQSEGAADPVAPPGGDVVDLSALGLADAPPGHLAGSDRPARDPMSAATTALLGLLGAAVVAAVWWGATRARLRYR